MREVASCCCYSKVTVVSICVCMGLRYAPNASVCIGAACRVIKGTLRCRNLVCSKFIENQFDSCVFEKKIIEFQVIKLLVPLLECRVRSLGSFYVVLSELNCEVCCVRTRCVLGGQVPHFPNTRIAAYMCVSVACLRMCPLLAATFVRIGVWPLLATNTYVRLPALAAVLLPRIRTNTLNLTYASV